MTTGEWAKVAADPLIREIERKIGAATGIEPHAHEDMVSVAQILPRGNQIRSGDYIPFGLHHDTDTKPNRASTVIVYLSTPERGGRTVFPLCGSWPPNPPVPRGELEQALSGMWGERDQRYSRQASFDPASSHPFNTILGLACRDELGVAVSPKEGTAIMFDQVLPGTHLPLKATWHAGCNVQQGRKVILQKFKELPVSARNPEQAHWTG
eukprot:TRINITY_DN30807_c0_g1_i1.p1 TRINITY_DN30807_c0_g1~~TRINITY_DN30807_c0_g1_i1.p1  ORF type:complete len:210 (+),score=29.03 TRINITY_DN30807_c0_g1_i1:368-997(+)